ncbi:MAG: DNA cytosine methyltransferase [Ruminococcus flavefaciens]|nr:DNA cytosine methyltransferase [Ruminococcus flavefaciens]
MKVLIACEESQKVCTAFRELGHEAYSCDIQECSGGHPEWHILGDVLPYINGNCEFNTMDGIQHKIDGKWDLLIAHPPCTYLSKVGANCLRINGKIQEDRLRKGFNARMFFMDFYNANCEHICVENPIPLKIFELPRYDQIIQPYMFEAPWLKTTCLWLHGLPKLTPDNEVKPTGKWVNCSDHRKYKNADVWSRLGTKNAKERSKTFPGIAKAMAEQWGQEMIKCQNN